MDSNLSSQIKNLSKPQQPIRKSDWADLYGLVDVACKALRKAQCESISMLGNGAYNFVYKLQFSDGSDVAAQLCKADEEDFVPVAKESELATMRFVRESGLYPDIPVPVVHAWDLTFANPARSPYVLMDVVQGINIDDAPRADVGLRSFDYLDPEEQLLVVKRLAMLQASLCKPVPFDRIGSLMLSKSGGFDVGPLASYLSLQPIIGGPYESMSDLWYSYIEDWIRYALKNWDRLEEDKLPGLFEDGTPRRFGEILQMLSALVPHFVPQPPYNTLVLHHPDLALRNIIFDANDFSKITGVIDWSGAQIIPIMFTAHFPGDLMSNGWNPVERTGYPDEGWHTVPHDWTSFGGSPDDWDAEYGDGGVKSDLAFRGAAMIRRFYLRQLFSACFSKEIHQQHGDADISRASVFAYAPYYLKFQEVFLRGPLAWFDHEKWVRETFLRLKVTQPQVGSLITGPNVYVSSVGGRACGLGVLENQDRDDTSHPEDTIS